MINNFTVWYDSPPKAVSLGVRRSGLARLCEDKLLKADTIRITR